MARDHNSRCVQAWAVARERVINPVAAEVEAVRTALLMAQQSGWRRVEVHVDIKALADSLQARTDPVMEASSIAKDIYLLQLMFESCIFSFVHIRFNRDCSVIATFAQENGQN